MEAKTHYTHVGIAVLLLAVSLLSASLWLSIGYDSKNYRNYLVYLNEPAGSLTEDSMVKYNGVLVGLVNSIELNQNNPQQVILILKIDEDIPITEGTQATLISQGITGTTYLGLSSTSPSLKPLKKTPDSPYPIIPSRPSFFYQLEKNIDKLTQQVNRVFDKENTDNIRLTLEHLEKLSAVFSNNNASIDESLKELPKLIKSFKVSAQKFDVMADDISVSGRQFTTTMKAGKNSIDQISQQTLPPATLLLRRLNDIAANLEKMSIAMRQDPSVVFRGSAPPKLGPGERP